MVDGVECGDGGIGGTFSNSVNLDSISEVRIPLASNLQRRVGTQRGAMVSNLYQQGRAAFSTYRSGWFDLSGDEHTSTPIIYFNNASGPSEDRSIGFRTFGADLAGR